MISTPATTTNWSPPGATWSTGCFPLLINIGMVLCPEPGELRAADQEIIATIEAGFETVGNLLESVKLRAALQEDHAAGTEANKYIDAQAPWFEIKTDKDAAAKTIYTTIRVIDSLKVLLAPFIPFTSEQLHLTWDIQIHCLVSNRLNRNPMR